MKEEQMLAIDKQSYITDLEEFSQHVKDGYSLPGDLKVDKKNIEKIVVTGMGGSAIPGDLLKVYMNQETKIPVFVNRNYSLPNFVDSKTLVFAISYSGNTEETVESLRDAFRKGCDVVAISSGGKIKEMANLHHKQFVQVPSKHQPRAMIGYLFFSMLKVLVNFGIIKDVSKEVGEISKYLDNDSFKKKGAELAKNMLDKIPLIYSSEELYPVAMRFKTQINENAKIHAFYNTFSEMNHNEILGFTNMDVPYHMVIFGSDSDHPRIKKRYEICKRLINSRVDVTQMNLSGNSFLKRMLTAIHLGDWTSYFMAIYKEVDPSPVDDIEKLKKDLKR